MTLPKQVTQFFYKKVAEFLFSNDPIFEMLKWLLSEFMKAESEIRVGAEKTSIARNEKLTFQATDRDALILGLAHFIFWFRN